MKTHFSKNRMPIRVFAAFLAVVILALTTPIISFAEESAKAERTVGNLIQPIALGSIPSEDYYRLLYANNIASGNSTIYDFEKTGFDFEEVSYNDTLTK